MKAQEGRLLLRKAPWPSYLPFQSLKKSRTDWMYQKTAEEGPSLFTWSIRIKYQYCTHPKVSKFYWICFLDAFGALSCQSREALPRRMYAYRRPCKHLCQDMKTQNHHFIQNISSCAWKISYHLILQFSGKNSSRVSPEYWCSLAGVFLAQGQSFKGRDERWKRYFGIKRCTGLYTSSNNVCNVSYERLDLIV